MLGQALHLSFRLSSPCLCLICLNHAWIETYEFVVQESSEKGSYILKVNFEAQSIITSSVEILNLRPRNGDAMVTSDAQLNNLCVHEILEILYVNFVLPFFHALYSLNLITLWIFLLFIPSGWVQFLNTPWINLSVESEVTLRNVPY